MSLTFVVWLSLLSGAHEMGLEFEAQAAWSVLAPELEKEPAGLAIGLLSSLAEDRAPGRALLGDLHRVVPHGMRRIALRELARKDDFRARRRLQILADTLGPADLRLLARNLLQGQD
jgi:hypothetical protein